MSKVIAIVGSVLRILGDIGRSPALSAFPSAEKFGGVVADLTDTANQLLERGEEGIEDLRAFKNKLADMRDRLNKGELPSEELLGEISTMKARSDAAHQELQDLKSKDGAAGGSDEAATA